MNEKTKSNAFSLTVLKTVPFLCSLFFIAATVLSVVFKIRYRIYDFFPMLTVVSLLFVLTAVYLKHEKNVMKAALGGILATLASWEFYYLADWIGSLLFDGEAMGDCYDWFSFGARILSSGLIVSILICHFLLTSEHKSNHARVRRNSFMLMAVAILFLLTLGFDFVEFFKATPGAMAGRRKTVNV